MFWPNISGSFDAKSKPSGDNTSSNRQPLGSLSRPKEVAPLIEEAASHPRQKRSGNSMRSDGIRKRSHGSKVSRTAGFRWTAERGLMSKVWLITGASRGFGRAFTEAVLEAGDPEEAATRNPERIVELLNTDSVEGRALPLSVTADMITQ